MADFTTVRTITGDDVIVNIDQIKYLTPSITSGKNTTIIHFGGEDAIIAAGPIGEMTLYLQGVSSTIT